MRSARFLAPPSSQSVCSHGTRENQIFTSLQYYLDSIFIYYDWKKAAQAVSIGSGSARRLRNEDLRQLLCLTLVLLLCSFSGYLGVNPLKKLGSWRLSPTWSRISIFFRLSSLSLCRCCCCVSSLSSGRAGPGQLESLVESHSCSHSVAFIGSCSRSYMCSSAFFFLTDSDRSGHVLIIPKHNQWINNVFFLVGIAWNILDLETSLNKRKMIQTTFEHHCNCDYFIAVL